MLLISGAIVDYGQTYLEEVVVDVFGLLLVLPLYVDEETDVLLLQEFVNDFEGLAHLFVVDELEIFDHVYEIKLRALLKLFAPNFIESLLEFVG